MYYDHLEYQTASTRTIAPAVILAPKDLTLTVLLINPENLTPKAEPLASSPYTLCKG